MATTVADVMTRDVVAVRKDAQFKDIVRVMRARRFSALPVLDDDNRVIGVVSEDDLLVREGSRAADGRSRFLFRHGDRVKAAGLAAGGLMTRPAITIRPDAGVAEAARTLHSRHLRRLPVVTGDGRIVGVVSRADLLGVYDRPDADIRTEIVEQVIESEFVLDRLAFTVTVESGVVKLSGPVASKYVALSLLDAVRQVDGVLAVEDRLSYPRSWQ
jgi:CBS-domain-containing membrane protein